MQNQYGLTTKDCAVIETAYEYLLLDPEHPQYRDTLRRCVANAFGLSVLVFASFGVAKYRISVYPLIVFMIIGLFLLSKVSEVKK